MFHDRSGGERLAQGRIMKQPSEMRSGVHDELNEKLPFQLSGPLCQLPEGSCSVGDLRTNVIEGPVYPPGKHLTAIPHFCSRHQGP